MMKIKKIIVLILLECIIINLAAVPDIESRFNIYLFLSFFRLFFSVNNSIIVRASSYGPIRCYHWNCLDCPAELGNIHNIYLIVCFLIFEGRGPMCGKMEICDLWPYKFNYSEIVSIYPLSRLALIHKELHTRIIWLVLFRTRWET